jgi:hypothetical protein
VRHEERQARRPHCPRSAGEARGTERSSCRSSGQLRGHRAARRSPAASGPAHTVGG